MRRCILRGMALVTFAGLLTALALIGPAPAQDKDEPAPFKPDPVADEVQKIALANDLAAYARKTKSPELLVAAARIMRQCRATPGSEKSTTTGSDQEEKAEPVSFLDETKKLLDEAAAMAPKDATITALIDRINKEPRSRGSVGGPRSYTHRPGGGKSRTWNLNFIGGQPATVSVNGNGVNSITLTVTGPAGHYLTWTGPNPTLSWVPRKTHGYTVTVTNNGPGPVQYTMFHN